jgi:C4-type Zn-finger protein
MTAFLLVLISLLLLWFGLSFFFRRDRKAKGRDEDAGGKAQKELLKVTTKSPPRCPLCSAELEAGQRVKSAAFTAINGERLMHISGCSHCLYGDRARTCPVCAAILTQEEILAARVFQTKGKTSVRIFGCSKCGGQAAVME